VRLIKLTQGQEAMVDDDKYDDLNSFYWFALLDSPSKKFYARRNTPDFGEGRSSESMHRRVIGYSGKELLVDHINGNTLDNQISNLRLVTRRENNQNKHCERSSLLPGASWHKGNKKWAANIMINGKTKYLGSFKLEHEAYATYLKSCKSYGFPIDLMIQKFGLPNVPCARKEQST